MKIGYIAMPREPVSEEECRLAVQEHVPYLELIFDDMTEEEFGWREEQRTLFQRHGIHIPAIGLWRRKFWEDEFAEEHEAQLRRAIEYCAFVECPVLVTGVSLPEGMDREEGWAKFPGWIGPFVDEAEKKGVRICLYCGHGTNLVQDETDFDRLRERAPRVGLKLDGGNLLAAGMDPVAVLHRHGKQVFHFHIKDMVILEGQLVDQCPAGLGQVPWGTVVNMLYIAGFDGCMCIEPHGRYWGHKGPHRRECITMSRDHVAQFLMPEDRP